jgi:Abnormal spindle-like microcephaly-assoc'd, ASPM-SPD-2-Hydin/Transmembrane protein 131-like N-terminal
VRCLKGKTMGPIRGIPPGELHAKQVLEAFDDVESGLTVRRSLLQRTTPQRDCRLSLLAATVFLAVIFWANGCALTGTTPNPNNAPHANASPSSLDFGDQDIGTTSSPLSVTLANSGGGDLVVSAVSSSPSQFAVSGANSTTIGPGKQVAYTITFTPAAAQPYSGALSFTTNSPAIGPVKLAGNGRKRVSISPSSLNFANQVVNTTSAPQTVTVSNTGGTNLVISGVAVSPAQFTFTGPVSTTVAPGASVSYAVSFTPALAQSYSGSLAFTMNASAAPVSLAGTGTAPPGPPQVSISPASLNFGNQVINTTSPSQTVTVTNTGGSNLTINSVTDSPSQFAFTGPGSTTVAPGANVAYGVTFSPTATQPYSGSLVFNTNASGVSFSVSEAGTGTTSSPGAICGKLDDGLIHIPPNYNVFAPPAKGQSYVDPQYGCSVVRLTGGVSEFGVAAHHYYGTLTSFSADDSKIMLFLDDGSPAIIDTSGNVVVSVSNMPAANTNNYPWDPSNPAVFYYTNSNQFMKGTISGNTVSPTALHTFTGYSSCMIPDQEDVTDDGTKIWLICTPSGGSASQNVAVLYNLSTDTVISNQLVVGAQEGGWHKIQIFPSGKMFLTGGSLCNGTQCIYNTDGTLYWQPPYNASAHSDVGTDLQGREVLISTANGVDSLNACGAEKWSSLTVVDTNAKAPVNCLIGAPPNPKIPAWEISYRDSANSATGKWVLLSMFDQGTCPDYSCFFPQDLIPTWQTLWAPYFEELVLVKIDGSQIYRLGYTWSRSAENYWAVPRASISRDGKYLVFDSNFDISNTGSAQYTDVYLIKIQ